MSQDPKDYLKVKFVCPIFKDDVWLMTGNPKAAEAFCKGLKLTKAHRGKCVDLADDKDELPSGFLIWIDSSENFYTMVHETLHLVRTVFEYHGVPFNQENDEFIASYQNYWVRKFWNTMSKGKTNGKRK